VSEDKMEQWKDSNVQKVSELLKDRMERGFIKYGTTTERTDLKLGDWLQHLQEELLDAAVYIERLKKEISAPSEINLGLDDNMSTVTVGQDVTLGLTNYGAAMPALVDISSATDTITITSLGLNNGLETGTSSST